MSADVVTAEILPFFATDTDRPAPVTAPDGVTYIGSRRYIPTRSGMAARFAGYDVHEWQIRGEVFVTTEDDTAVHSPCSRCGGCGQFSYNQLDGTMCYGCNGDGVGKAVNGWADAFRLVKGREARRRAEQRKAMRLAWDEAHAWDAWYGTRTGVIAALLAQPRDEYTGDFRTDFLGKMASIVSGATPLTEKQEAAVVRTLGQRVQRAEAKQAAGHWGVEGKRAEVAVKLVSVKDFDGDYGTRCLVIMETAEGHTLKTWASGEFGWTAFGKMYDADGNRRNEPINATIKATVKDGGHTEYNGTPQTEVQRVKVVAWN
jgi:hypothetical protein